MVTTIDWLLELHKLSGADSLVLLSDVDGLYTQNPKIYKNAKLLKVIKNIDKNIERNCYKKY